MQTLNLPAFPFRTREEEGKRQIFDVFRKRYVSLTPEEWVRQHFLSWLHLHKHYPLGLIAVEISLKYHQLQKRADSIIYGKEGQPLMMIECKAPSVRLSQDVFDQIARYNFSFGVKYLVVTNGLVHYCCRREGEGTDWVFLEEVPDFDSLAS